MNKIVCSLLFVVCCLFCSSILFAQKEVLTADTINHDNKTYVVIPAGLETLEYKNTTYVVVPEMYDKLKKNGKIYVVVAVCLTILIGLFIYIFLLDRKISRLEKGKD